MTTPTGNPLEGDRPVLPDLASNALQANPFTTSPLDTAPLDGMTLDPTAADCTPLQCETAMNLINEARNPSLDLPQLGQLRGELSHCAPCRSAFDIEVKLRSTFAPRTSELPTIDFRTRITETLASVDLSQLDITDF